MEKTFQLEQREVAALSQLEQEKTQALAAYGALTIDRKNAKRRLEAVMARQDAFVKDAVMNRGIDRYDGARMGQGTLTVALPDVFPIPQAENAHKPNGHALALES